MRTARYNRSTLNAEDAALGVAAQGRTGVVLRFAGFHGPGDVVAAMAIGAVRRGWSPFLGDRRGYLPLLTHDDAASVAVAALHVPTGIYNVVDDEPMTREALTLCIARLLGARPPRFLPAWIAHPGSSLIETQARSQRLSNAKCRLASGWQPATPNACVGFRRIVQEEDARRQES